MKMGIFEKGQTSRTMVACRAVNRRERRVDGKLKEQVYGKVLLSAALKLLLVTFYQNLSCFLFFVELTR